MDRPAGGTEQSLRISARGVLVNGAQSNRREPSRPSHCAVKPAAPRGVRHHVSTKSRVLNAVLVVLSAGNLGAVWFANGPGEQWHATVHAALALGFGLWALQRMLPRQPRDGMLTGVADERLERIERAIDAVAIEVERISEMERFASKILAARASELEPRVAAPGPASARTITPV